MRVCADLHIHTNESDGVLSPIEVVAKAAEVNLRTIAITDHDSVNGITAAKIAAMQYDIDVISGIEFSCLDENREVHMLGYYIDISNRNLREEANYIAIARRERAEKIVRKLNKLGVHISYKQVQEIAGGGVIGRPHIAKAMIQEGYISKIQEAFTPQYIDRGGRAYVERYKLSVENAIQLIHNAGGVAVIAHPGLCNNASGLEEVQLEEYIQHGLDGIEVFHSAHSGTAKKQYLQWADQHRLLVTGGSDYHGGNVHEGAELGKICLAEEYVRQLKSKAMMAKFKY